MISDFGVSEDKQVEELVFADGKTVYLSEIYAKLLKTKESLSLKPELFLEAKYRLEATND